MVEVTVPISLAACPSWFMWRAVSSALATASVVVRLARSALWATPWMVPASSEMDVATVPTLTVVCSMAAETECMFPLTFRAESRTALARPAMAAELFVSSADVPPSSADAPDSASVAATISESISRLLATMAFRAPARCPMLSRAGYEMVVV